MTWHRMAAKFLEDRVDWREFDNEEAMTRGRYPKKSDV